MTIQIVTSGPYFGGTSPISFSEIRENFRAQNPDGTFTPDNAPLSMSSLYRNTSTDIQNPVVPDSTENRLTGPSDLPPGDKGVPTSGVFPVSQLRNAIKYYSANQTDTNLNLDIDSLNWNSNLEKNIRKFTNINGTVGSSDTALPAGTFEADAVNFTIQVNGNVYGAGGVAVADAAGTAGGTALLVNSPGGKNNKINMSGTGKLYGGGGGGGDGGDGGKGGRGGNSERGCTTPGGCVACGTQQGGSGGAGGAGGLGGPGRGYNNETGSRQGSEGEEGKDGKVNGVGSGFNSGRGGDGGEGGAGGAGGDWGSAGNEGEDGEKGDNGGGGFYAGACNSPTAPGNGQSSGKEGDPGTSGGAAGLAADGGINFSVEGTINSTTIKGATF